MLKKYYYDKNIECCLTCRFIDEYAFQVGDVGGVPHGWDGSAWCCKYDEGNEVSFNNRDFISPLWKRCAKYERCTERQAVYLDVFDDETQSIIPNPNDISKLETDA